MEKSKRITDGALLVAVYIVLLLLLMFVPFVILFGLFVLPIPFILYASRHDLKSAILMFFVTIIVSFIFATVITLPLTLFAGIGGIVIGLAIKRNINPYETWAKGTIGFIIGLVLNILFVQYVLNISIIAEFNAMIEESIQFIKGFMQQTDLLDGNEEQIQLLEEQMYMFVDLLPSSITVMAIIVAFISQWLSYHVINRLEGKKLSFPSFQKFNLPISIFWMYLIVLILSFFNLTEDQPLYIIVINAMTILVFLLIIQGFSFVFFYTQYKNLHISIPVIFVVISFILPFILLFFVRLLGIIDIGFSLKERIAKTEADK